MACFGWGIADFIGGIKSRDVSVLAILFISTVSGMTLLFFITLGLGQPFPKDPTLLWAILAGLVGVVAMFLLYRSLAVGIISILAPISATGVILPVLWGLFHGDTMSGLSLFGIFIAALGSLMAAMERRPEKNTKRLTKGVGMALGAAFFVGLYFIITDKACTHHPVWAALIMRCTTFIALLPTLFLTKTKVRIGRTHLPVILFMGCADTTAAFCFALATSDGMLSQVAVISSLYPAVTVLLSTFFIGERMAKTQTTGVVLAIFGIVLISAF